MTSGQDPYPCPLLGDRILKLNSTSWSKTGERGGGLLFAIGFNGLLVLALLTLAPRPEPQDEDPRNPVTFEMAPAPKAEKKPAKAEKREERREKAEKREAPPEKTEPPKVQELKPIVELPVPVTNPVVLPPSPLPFLELERDQMAAADIGRMPKVGASDGSSDQGDSAAVAGPGEGPGGVRLFDAEWYRRPTPAELATYLPANAPARGWGLVACKTVDRYRVENCQALGESPTGSGFARAVRLAAWQFLVLPPRVNGKVMVGSWVRIRIDYVAGGPEKGAAGG